MKEGFAMGHDHSHSTRAAGNERALWMALALTTIFLVTEVVAGVLTNSLALISDAAHMFTDAAALAIALAAARIARRPADRKRTFGYYRFEILAAAFNAILLFLVAVYILFEAYQRLQSTPEVQSSAMLAVAVVGLVVNLLSMRLLSGGRESNLNMRGAYLEVWSDMLGSFGVIAGALIIAWTKWMWVDSLIAVGIGLWVLPRTWRLLRESLNILLEGVPEGVALDQIEAAVLTVPGVASLHDLHVWAIASNQVSVSMHVVSRSPDTFELTIAIRSLLVERFGVAHTTVQIERDPCEQEESHRESQFRPER